MDWFLYDNGLVMKELTKNLNTAHAPTEFFYQIFLLLNISLDESFSHVNFFF